MSSRSAKTEQASPTQPDRSMANELEDEGISRRRFMKQVGGTVGILVPPLVAAQCRTVEIGNDEEYDVIIVGSGISGAIVAKHLANKEIEKKKYRILILEAGDGELNDRTREISNYFSALNKFPEAPFDPNSNAPSPTIADLIVTRRDAYLQQRGPIDFGTTYVRKTGGTMWHWMGTALRFLRNDFLLTSKFGIRKEGRADGASLDWPIKYDDLGITGRDKKGLSYYDMAEDEIGVSASTEEQDPQGKQRLFRKGRKYPMPSLPPTLVDKYFEAGVSGMEFDGLPVWVYRTPAGRNSVPYKNRPACAGNSTCVPLCRIRAKYDPTVTLDEVTRMFGDRVILRKKCVASRLLYSGRRVTGVEYIQYDNPMTAPIPLAPKVVRARVYVLAANGIESPKLLLASGLGERNKNIGRNLMDHPFFLRFGLTKDGTKVYPYRGPLSTGGLDGLRDGKFREKRAAYRIEIGNDGWALAAGDPNATVIKAIDRDGQYGEKLVESLNDTFTRQVRIGFELEQLPWESNRVELSERKDNLGIQRPAVTYSLHDYERNGLRSAVNFWNALHKRLEIQDSSRRVSKLDPALLADSDMCSFMGAGHIMGTCRMGDCPSVSVVNREQRSHDLDNLFIVGSSVFPTGGTANPTLTIAALAFWAADNIDRQLST